MHENQWFCYNQWQIPYSYFFENTVCDYISEDK